jgi:hypothetical protein
VKPGTIRDKSKTATSFVGRGMPSALRQGYNRELCLGLGTSDVRECAAHILGRGHNNSTSGV